MTSTRELKVHLPRRLIASKCSRRQKSAHVSRRAGECAAPLGKPSAPSAKKASNGPILVAETSASENLEGERKTVTMLFADIKGSMDLIEDLDPEEARGIVDPALKVMMEAVQRYGGYVAQSTVDA